MTRIKKILNDGLTNKQRILKMVERWKDDISFDQALYQMYALKKITDGIKSAEESPTFDFDEVFDELERECDEEENALSAIRSSTAGPEGDQGSNRRGRHAQNGQVIRGPAKKARKRSA